MTILCSLMSKDQFGVVEAMHMDNWEVETQQTEAKQKELQDFQKSHPSLPFATLHFFLDVEGSVWTCGRNDFGQLGLGHTMSKFKAENVVGLPAIKSMAGGAIHSLFVDFEGSVWACGYNGHDQLGLGDTTDRNKAEKVAGLPRINTISAGNYHSHFIDEEGGVWVCGCNGNGQLGLGHSTNQSKA